MSATKGSKSSIEFDPKIFQQKGIPIRIRVDLTMHIDGGLKRITGTEKTLEMRPGEKIHFVVRGRDAYEVTVVKRGQ